MTRLLRRVPGENRGLHPAARGKHPLRSRLARGSLLSRGTLPGLRRFECSQENGSRGRRSKCLLGDCSRLGTQARANKRVKKQRHSLHDSRNKVSGETDINDKL